MTTCPKGQAPRAPRGEGARRDARSRAYPLPLQGWPGSGIHAIIRGGGRLSAPDQPATTEDELTQLRRRVAELEADAGRYRALVDSGISVQRYRPDGLCVAVNAGWEQLWRIPVQFALLYNIREDPQIREHGFMGLIDGAFEGQSTQLPAIRYDPEVNDQVGNTGRAAWVASAMAPVRDAGGAVQEVIQLHLPVGELRQSEDELRAANRQLEAAVQARTAELEQKLRLIEDQRDAIKALSTPVLQVWPGVLALPLIGHLDRERAHILQETLLHAVVATRARHVLLDVTGVPVVDLEAAGHLRDVMRATQLLGSRCALVGISPAMAGTLVALDLQFDRIPTFASLQDGLRHALHATAARTATSL